MKERMFIISDYATGKNVKKVRKELGLTQKEFAQLVNSSQSTIERWETTEENITGPLVLLLRFLEKYPEYVKEIRIPKKVFPMRLEYMYGDTLCTIIDVDEVRQKVHIVNYTDNLMFRAFGKEESPSYEEYMQFLESRCFPKSRDKMKLILKDLDLPFYDPFLIIEKTQGRMAEDDFWIRIVR